MANFNNVNRGSASEYFEKVNKELDDLRDYNNNPNGNSAVQSSLLTNRNPWIMSTTEWLEDGKGIIWSCNPSEISWNIRLRQATSKNAYSTVTHNWPNDNRGTHFDEFVLNMTFQSGNLMPYNRRDVNDNTAASWDIVSPGLVNFYDFLKLMDAPKLTSPKRDGTGGGRTNHVIIKYSSNIFPSLTLIGQFDPEGVKFTDSASDPNQVNSWSATFIVLDSNPRISSNTGGQSNSELLSAYLSNMGSKRG